MKSTHIPFFIAIAAICFSCKKESLSSAIVTSSSVDKTVVGRQQVITVPTSDYTYPNAQALLWLPSNYSTTTGTYPLIIALDGVGETGTDINLLLNQGTIARYISDGWDPKATNPTTHTTSQFIVFTPQGPPNTWGWSAPHVKTMLAYLKTNYRINVNRVYITGYSAGGWGLWSCITDDTTLCKQFKAIAPLSSAAAGNPSKITNVDKYKIACWSACGTQDGFYNNSVAYVNTINNYTPPPTIPAVFTAFQGVGHSPSAWGTFYNPTWRTNALNLNFYEWLLQYPN